MDVTLTLRAFMSTQEEDLQEIVTKISSKQEEYEQARAHLSNMKASYEEAEQKYKQLKEQINTIREEADPIKVLCMS